MCSECCIGNESNDIPNSGNYNTSNNPNGQPIYTGGHLTAEQKQAFLNEIMNMLKQLDPVSSDCIAERFCIMLETYLPH
jgi:hypothetical protein